MTATWRTAMPDWEERLLQHRPLVPDLPLFDEPAARAVRNFRRLRLPDVSGHPTFGEAGFEWFEPIVAALFGSYDAATRRRMIQEAFILVPKKNGKSTAAAAVMLVALLMNERPAAEAVLVAPTKEVADITYGQASGMIRLSPQLRAIFEPTNHQRLIRGMGERDGVKLMIKAADVDVVTGGKQTYTLIDETHEFASKSRAADLFVELRGALAARPDGFLMQITTQSKQPPAGVFKAELARARRVRDGEIDLPMLPVLYELPERLQKALAWRERQYWGVVNPSLGRSVDEAFLEREIAAAEDEGTHKTALIASQHFNVQVGIGHRTDAWAGAEYWARRVDPTLTFEEVLRRSEVVIVGIDGGGLDDLLGFAVLGRCRDTRQWLAWSYAWCHHGVLDRRKTIAARLGDFAAAGELTIVASNPKADELYFAMSEATARAESARQMRDRLIEETEATAREKSTEVEWSEEDQELIGRLRGEIRASGFPDDIAHLVAIIERIKTAGMLAEVAVDPAGLGLIVDALDSIGVTEDSKLLVGVGQGWRLSNAIKTGERRLENGTLWHGGSGLMDWCVGNVKIEPTATSIRATKQNAGDAKIDPWAALMNACDRMSLNPGAKKYQGIYSDPVRYAAVYGEARVTDTDRGEWSPEILADMAHPLFEEHKARFNRWHDAELTSERVDW